MNNKDSTKETIKHKSNVAMNEQTNLLEENLYYYSLQDVQEPNLFRELFEYDKIPKISFNHRSVPINMPEEIWITDSTFRDGQQSRSPFTVQQIVDLYKLMHKLGGKKGLVRQTEFFLYTENDRQAVRRCQELGYEFPEVTTWIRAHENDFKLVKEMNVSETGILVSASDYHIFKKMNLTRKQAMEKYITIVKRALDEGIRPRCHLEDITRADFYGFVVPFVLELQRLSEEYETPIKIRACDTMGYGVSLPGVSLPRSVSGIVYGLTKYAQTPSALLEWHGHNDFYSVVNNSMTAWLYGCASVNCTLMGIGERTGNCPLDAMAIQYAALRGTTDGMDLSVITDIARYFQDEIGFRIPSRTPFVGKSFNSTRAGIHADGMLKDPEIYNIFDTETILKRPPTVCVDSHSGSAGIAHWMNTYFGFKGEDAVDKKSDIVMRMKELVDKEYERGRNTVMGDEELAKIAAQLDPQYDES
ncbi:MAG: 2-isopropylmalate synthase [Christensenellales bacterium]|jgi:isopropylmalate/homocitrate/citramalate synthase